MGGGYRLLTVGSRACLGGLVKPLEYVIGPLAVPTGIHCQCLQPTLSSPTSTATNYHNCTSLAFFTLNPHLRNSLSLLSDLHQLTVTRRLLPSLCCANRQIDCSLLRTHPTYLSPTSSKADLDHCFDFFGYPAVHSLYCLPSHQGPMHFAVQKQDICAAA